jgi:hypothetical protein
MSGRPLGRFRVEYSFNEQKARRKTDNDRSQTALAGIGEFRTLLKLGW